MCKEKVTKKKAHPVLAPSAPAALRVRKSGRNFCKGHPCPLQKRRASMRAALRVVSAGLAAAVWGPQMQTAYATATATATTTATTTATRVCISNTMLKAAKQQSSKAAKQQSSKAGMS
ncbi:hypothetical protein J7405_05460 [Xanthomonas phaseoli pv. manihotis]|uniref:Uncharacterized protein n=2 Tax=Xanthomonas TaxID=338 RepID=A0A8I2BT90_XANMN|nr:hypothetical protein [Xanthomonas phaseoli]MBO9758999.1 hypothetical protein [Xanthomonas phaseoli pv. manihotis]